MMKAEELQSMIERAVGSDPSAIPAVVMDQATIISLNDPNAITDGRLSLPFDPIAARFAALMGEDLLILAEDRSIFVLEDFIPALETDSVESLLSPLGDEISPLDLLDEYGDFAPIANVLNDLETQAGESDASPPTPRNPALTDEPPFRPEEQDATGTLGNEDLSRPLDADGGRGGVTSGPAGPRGRRARAEEGDELQGPPRADGAPLPPPPLPLVERDLSGGSDRFDGSDSTERLSVNAGRGNDRVTLGDLDDVADGGDGKDALYGRDGDDILSGGRQDDKLFGGDGDDTLAGGHGRDQLNGGDGDDTFILSGADDARDSLKGGAGTDTVRRGDGDLTLRNFAANNDIERVDARGEDIKGTTAGDRLDFSNAEIVGDSAIDVGRGNDRVTGSAGDDEIRGGQGKDNLSGGAGNDRLDGGDQDDKLFGGDGDDTLIGGAGRDQLTGGDGDDTFILSGADDARDSLKGGAGTDTARRGDGDLTLRNFAANNDIERVDARGEDIKGTTAGDRLDFSNAEIVGDSAIDVGRGNDRVTGSAGDDEIRGGQGKDNLSGGAGNDRIDGGDQDDKLFGGDGDDTLIGGAGRDQLTGGDGDDTFILSGANDARDALSGGDGVDTVVRGDGDLELRSFSASNGIERVDARGQAIEGTTGNDVLDFSDATLVDTTGIEAGRGNDRITGSGGDDTISGGDGKDTLYGGDGADTLLGGNQDDRLFGGDGADRLDGGAGRDRLTGGDGGDVFALGGGGIDTIVDFNAAQGDKLDLASVVDTGAVDDIDAYIRLEDDGRGNTLVRVNEDGSGDAGDFDTVGVLQGVTDVSLTDILKTEPQEPPV